MDSLNWLTRHRLQSVERRETVWLFTFDDEVLLSVECLWRLLEAGRLRLTSEDDGQPFGMPAAVVAADEATLCLVGSSVASVTLRDGTLDLELEFDTGHLLQVLPTSAGYEAWQVSHRQGMYVAVAGGELVTFGGGTDRQ